GAALFSAAPALSLYLIRTLILFACGLCEGELPLPLSSGE
ncbi:hypothetical protein HMPREF1986_00576, partial [Oribacterium sp. oral taxon 078 str. F0263]